MAKKKVGVCVYCGNFGKITKDHVIPKSLFIQPYPENFITVPACPICNSRKAKDDDFLRDFLVADYRAKHSHIAQQLLHSKVSRAFTQNHSELLREAIPKAKLRPLMSKGGIFLGQYRMHEIDENRINFIFERLVRGLYYDALNKRFSNKRSFQVFTVLPHDYQSVFESFQLNTKPSNKRRIGENTFECAFRYAEEDAEATWWLLLFYETVLFTVSTFDH